MFRKYVLTFLLGAAAGAAIALLYAPMPGRKMQRKVSDVLDKVEEKVGDVQAAVRKFAS